MAFISSYTSALCSKGKLGLVVNKRLTGTPAMNRLNLSKVLGSSNTQCLQHRLSSTDTPEVSRLTDRQTGQIERQIDRKADTQIVYNVQYIVVNMQNVDIDIELIIHSNKKSKLTMKYFTLGEKVFRIAEQTIWI